uniref:Uncharacterized protein n=1 Tax=Ditylenchus dipsaci TaxID=166011 RepID=A0A915DBX2_9BILA
MSLSKANRIFVLNRRAKLAADYLLFLRVYSSAAPAIAKQCSATATTSSNTHRFLDFFYAAVESPAAIALGNKRSSGLAKTFLLYMQTRILPDGSRVSKYLDSDKLMTHRFDDARTLYEVAEQGRRPKTAIHLDILQPADRKVRENGQISAQLDQPMGNKLLLESTCAIGGVDIRGAGLLCFSNVIVPLYETLGLDSSPISLIKPIWKWFFVMISKCCGFTREKE